MWTTPLPPAPMSSGPGACSASSKVKVASTITSRRATAIVEILRILLRASRIKAQLMARRASISKHHPTIHLMRTGVHTRVDSHKVPT